MKNAPRHWFVRPLGRKSLQGQVDLPGDLAVAHRALMLLAVARGTGRIRRLPLAEEMNTTQRVLFQTIAHEGDTADIREVPHCDCGGSAVTIQLMMGLLAGRHISCILDGDESLKRRPLDRVAHPLSLLGASITTTSGGLPVAVQGRPLTGAEIRLEEASSSIKSALLFAGLHAEGETVIRSPLPTCDHTERLIRFLGGKLTIADEGRTIRVRGGPLAARDLDIPGDVSYAAYLLAAVLLAPGSRLLLKNAGVNPTRTGLLAALARAGARIDRLRERETCLEPRADLEATTQPFGALAVEPAELPFLLNVLPLVPLLATQADAETSRIRLGEAAARDSVGGQAAAVARELKAVGVTISPVPDGYEVPGRQKINGGNFDCRGDWRLALVGVIAGLVSRSGVTVRHAACVTTAFPAALDQWRQLGAEIEETTE